MKLISNLQQSSKLKLVLEKAVMVLLFLYIFLIPTFGEKSSTLNILVYFAMAMLFICVFLHAFLFGSFKLNKVTLLIPFFAVFTFIGTAIYSHEFRRFLSLILLSLSFYTFIYSFKILKNKYVIFHIISLALMCFSLVFIVKYRSEFIHFKEFISGSFRLGEYFDNPNGVAAFEVVAFSTSLYLVLFYKKKIRFFHLLPAILSIVVGVSTGSRSFLIAIGAFLLIYLFFVFKKHKWIYLVAVAVLVGAFAAFLQLPFMSTIKERLVDAFQTLFGKGSDVDTSVIERVVYFQYGFFLGLKNGLFGLGANGFSIYSGVGTYAHNNFAEVICDFGFIGFVLFYAPLLILLICAIKNPKVDKPVVVAFIFYYLLISFSNVLYYKKMYYMMLAFMYYLVFFCDEAKTKLFNHQLRRIIFTCDTMGSGGAERVIANLANSFISYGIDVLIVGVADSKSPKSFYSLVNGVSYISLNYKLGKRSRALKRVKLLRKTILENKPDVVISFLPHINVYTWISLIGTEIPFIVSERNNPATDPKNKFLRLLKRIAFSSADGCVFQTSGAQHFYKESVIKKSVVIPNPILLPSDVYHQSKIKTIIAVGRLTGQKNHKILLQSFLNVNKCFNNQYLLKIYGDGPLKNELVFESKQLGIGSFVVFAGNDTEWLSKEKDSSLFVLSSDFEGMPNSLMEALSIGIPCVSTDCPSGGPKELLSSGFNLTLCNINDCDDMTRAMINTIQKYGSEFDAENIDCAKKYNISDISNKWLTY